MCARFEAGCPHLCSICHPTTSPNKCRINQANGTQPYTTSQQRLVSLETNLLRSERHALHCHECRLSMYILAAEVLVFSGAVTWLYPFKAVT